ncbi:MAG TPA: hypothetical protein VLL97_12530, partial [Acidobacteriota bacterium]|nr:hypothetical protein [Acidobacteriota bacterium]
MLTGVRKGTGIGHTFGYNRHAELVEARLPLGAGFKWEYATLDYPQGSVRGITGRGITLSPAEPEAVYRIERARRGSRPARETCTILNEPDGRARRIWLFSSDPQLQDYGLLSVLEERDGRSNAILRRTSYRWKYTVAGVPYVGSVSTALDPHTRNEKVSRTETDCDLFGNIVETRQYDYDNPATPMKITRNTYLDDDEYLAGGILNRLVSTTMSDGIESVELLRNQYDTTPLIDRKRTAEHDGIRFGVSRTARGNLTESIAGGVYRRFHRDITGSVCMVEDSSGVRTEIVSTAGTGSGGETTFIPNGNNDLSIRAFRDISSRLSAVLLPNGVRITVERDRSGRPTALMSAEGARYDIACDGGAAIVSLNGRYRKITADDFGRLRFIEEGDETGAVSIIEYRYGPVANAPSGKCVRASLPHASGASAEWVSLEYDALGRATAYDFAGHGGSRRFAYAGNAVTIYHVDGGWKKLIHDAAGNLRNVTTPDPDGGPDQETVYRYTPNGKVSGVSMLRPDGVQTRTFTYDAGGRAVVRNHVERGPERRSYNSDGTLA